MAIISWTIVPFFRAIENLANSTTKIWFYNITFKFVKDNIKYIQCLLHK